jgi:hypothetical protein
MSQYLLSMYYPQDTAAVPDDLGAIMERVDALNAEIRAANAWVFTAGLAPAFQARVITAGEPPVATDGPYLESKEHLGGFWVIAADTADAAAAWAAKASAAVGLPIEVREAQS